jgi:hypothetical protein
MLKHKTSSKILTIKQSLLTCAFKLANTSYTELKEKENGENFGS